MSGKWCAVTNNYGYMCGDRAVFEVYWTSTGSDAIRTCAQHTAKAIRQLRAKTNNGLETTFHLVMIN